MTAKPVQISIDEELLRRIDQDPEVGARGRSAFIRSAVELYLRLREQQRIDEELESAYRGEAEAMADEIAELIEDQSWPET